MSESETERTLEQEFTYCEGTIEDLIADRLGDSRLPERNERLKNCVHTLQSLNDLTNELSLFSTNDQAEELPTSSLRYLLIPVYLAYTMQEIQVGMDERKSYLKAAKSYYREYLQNLLVFELINFKLPWIDSERGDKEGNSGIDIPPVSGFKEATARREKKLTRLNQMTELEKALVKLRIEHTRNDDEFTQRELIITLLRLWAIRTLNELDIIEEELKLLEHLETNRSNQTSKDTQTSSRGMDKPVTRLKPFVIARSEEQKRVFGLGYPSVPTVTVDEWFNQMQKNGGFGAKPFTIQSNQTNGEESSDEDENGTKQEAKRQSEIRRDEWKEMNPRGWGNTYNKG